MRQSRISTTAAEPDGPDAVDEHVGRRMRARRKAMGISQTALADAVGITFQQVQKYERAANRVSASRLWHIAQQLNVDVAYFFDGLERVLDAETPALTDAAAWLSSDQAEAFACMIAQLTPAYRRQVVKVAEGAATIALMSEPPRPDTPETVANKAKAARTVMDLARGLHG